MSTDFARKKSSEKRTGLIFVFASSLLLVIGLLTAIYLNLVANETKFKTHFVSFVNVPVTSNSGRMEISFDLAVAHTDLATVNQAKKGLAAHLRSNLSALDPNAFYSRANKEWLAKHIKLLVNRELGAQYVDAVYFGNFKISGSAPRLATAAASSSAN